MIPANENELAAETRFPDHGSIRFLDMRGFQDDLHSLPIGKARSRPVEGSAADLPVPQDYTANTFSTSSP
jgi:hypothetical protein